MKSLLVRGSKLPLRVFLCRAGTLLSFQYLFHLEVPLFTYELSAEWRYHLVLLLSYLSWLSEVLHLQQFCLGWLVPMACVVTVGNIHYLLRDSVGIMLFTLQKTHAEHLTLGCSLVHGSLFLYIILCGIFYLRGSIPLFVIILQDQEPCSYTTAPHKVTADEKCK